jgi:hypothetical protein
MSRRWSTVAPRRSRLDILLGGREPRSHRPARFDCSQEVFMLG